MNEKQAEAFDWRQGGLYPAELPTFPDFNDAMIENAIFGPRQELTLTLSPLIWVGHQGHRGPPVKVRFGGIANRAEVEAVFAEGHHLRSELAYFRYDAAHHSKPGDIYVHLEFERVEARIVIHCRNFTVTEAEQPES